MEISLLRRAAIVTGGSKGIGLAVAARFATSGADVAIVARTAEPLKEAVAAIRKSTRSRVIGVQADVSKAADVQRAYDEVMEAFDKVDIVVNNTGTSQAMPFDKVTDEILYDDLELKLFAAVRLIRLVMSLALSQLRLRPRRSPSFLVLPMIPSKSGLWPALPAQTAI